MYYIFIHSSVMNYIMYGGGVREFSNILLIGCKGWVLCVVCMCVIYMYFEGEGL